MDKDEDGPERTCVVTRRKGAPETMIRFVLGPDGTVVPDIRRKLPGRGVWVGADRAIVAEAVRKQAFARGLKTKVAVDPGLPDLVDDLLARDALQSLAMANKIGLVTTGHAKVEAALASGTVLGLLHATDGSADGVRKLEAAARRHATNGKLPTSIKLFASEELDLALGRTNVIHAALAEGPAGHAFLTRCHRVMLYRSTGSPDLSADAEAGAASHVPG